MLFDVVGDFLMIVPLPSGRLPNLVLWVVAEQEASSFAPAFFDSLQSFTMIASTVTICKKKERFRSLG